MKKLLFTLLFSSLAFAQNYWESEFPDHINKFIYEQVHYRCTYADYVDGIIADLEMDFPQGKIYTAIFSMYGDIQDSSITVSETFEGDLEVDDLVCPNP